MPHERLAQHLFLPDLKIVKEEQKNGTRLINCKKVSDL
jgi:hypothetical protein